MIEVYGAIREERAYQDHKHGTIDKHGHTVAEWILIMQKELDEARTAWCDGAGDDEALCEILQVVATGVACMEQHGAVTRWELDVRNVLDPPPKRKDE